jgi:hypothetical protein
MLPSLVRYVLTAAIRDRLVVTLIAAMVVSVSLAIFMGSAAISEKGNFAIVFAGAGLRLTGVLALVLFVVFFIRRSFEARDVEFILSRPVTRVEFILSYSAGFSILALLLALVEGLCIYAPSPQSFDYGHLMWTLTIMMENIIMVNVALFFAMILSSAATAAMAAAGFYVLTRMMGQILGIIDGHVAGGSVIHGLENMMQGISMFLPRLDLMGQTSWLIYDPGTANIGFILFQGAAFLFLIVLGALLDLARRQF